MWKVNPENRETVHTFVAIALIISGMTAFFLDLCVVGTPGDVGTGTLTYIGEAFTLAGALFGIVSYVGREINRSEDRIKRIEKSMGIKEEEK